MGHYAASHQGVCVEFDTSKWPVAMRPLLFPVSYLDERPTYHFPRGPGQADRREWTLEMAKALTTKAKCWSYEEEWRLLVYGSAGKCVELPKGVVSGVIFGAMAREEDCRSAAGWAEVGFPASSFSRIQIDHRSYELCRTPCSEWS